MKKKSFVVIAVFFVLAAVATLFSACSVIGNNTADGGDETDVTECEHNWEKSSYVPGDCRTYGYTVFTCTKCGETKIVYDTEYGAHSFLNHVCTICGERESTKYTVSLGDDVTAYIYSVGVATSTYEAVIGGNGACEDFSSSPFSGYSDTLVNVIIESGVTSLGDYVFSNCTALKTVSGGADLTKIGAHAFENCSSIVSLAFADKITEIGGYAFASCVALKTFAFDGDSAKIEPFAFYRCNALTEISVPLPKTDGTFSAESVFGAVFGYTDEETGGAGQTVFIDGKTYYYYVPNALVTANFSGKGEIPQYMFYGCGTIVTLTVSGNVSGIAAHAFEKMAKLQSASLGESLASIGDYAFASCSELHSFNAFTFAGDGPTLIREYAFSRCSSLKTVKLGAAVSSIGSEAFSNCSSMTSVTLGAGLKTITEGAFNACTKLGTVFIDSGDAVCLPDNASDLFSNAGEIYVLDKLTVPTSSYISKNYDRKGLDNNLGYVLWNKN
jgi:hypothetical protein